MSGYGYGLHFDIGFEKLGLRLPNGHNVLQDASGTLQHGRLSAVMGPSGSGKTTFLSTLCGRASYGTTTGHVLLNGTRDSLTKYRKLVGFVPQEDVMLRELTVEENLLHSAATRLPVDTSAEQLQQIVDEVISLLELEDVRTSVIGDEITRGISGGQRKRVNVGLELVAKPSVLFLDEPTSGLDSASSFSVVQALRKVAHDRDLTVVAVVHQPRFEIFMAFDDVLLLAKGGKPVYLGSTAQALQYFMDAGFDCPGMKNPADHFLDTMSDPEHSAALVEYWRSYSAIAHDRNGVHDDAEDAALPRAALDGSGDVQAPIELYALNWGFVLLGMVPALGHFIAAYLLSRKDKLSPMRRGVGDPENGNTALSLLSSAQTADSYRELPGLDGATDDENDDSDSGEERSLEEKVKDVLAQLSSNSRTSFVSERPRYQAIDTSDSMGNTEYASRTDEHKAATREVRAHLTAEMVFASLQQSDAVEEWEWLRSPGYLGKRLSLAIGTLFGIILGCVVGLGFGVWLSTRLQWDHYILFNLCWALLGALSGFFLVKLEAFRRSRARIEQHGVPTALGTDIVERRVDRDVTSALTALQIGCDESEPHGPPTLKQLRQLYTADRDWVELSTFFTVSWVVVGPCVPLYAFFERKPRASRRLGSLMGLGFQLGTCATLLASAFILYWIQPDGVAAPSYEITLLEAPIMFFVATCMLIVMQHRYHRLPSRDRRTPSFLQQTLLIARRALKQLGRDKKAFAFDIGIALLSGTFLGLVYHNKKYEPALPESIVELCPAEIREFCEQPKSDPVFGQSSLNTLAISLCAVASSLRVFGNEKAVFTRESESGQSTEAYFVGKQLAQVLPMVMSTLAYAMPFVFLARPLDTSFFIIFAIFLSVYFTAASFSILVSIVMPVSVMQLVAVLSVLVCMMFGGAQPRLPDLRDHSLLGGVLFYPTTISYVRWAGELYYLTLIKAYQPEIDVAQPMHDFYGYAFHNEPICWGALWCIGLVVRIIAFVALVKREP